MRRPISLGFTLIELLIVVAIIAILAAIAVPNFLEAQVRAKVSRAKADMRTMITGIESYAVDNNKYPDISNSDVLAITPPPKARIGIEYSRRTLVRISTPIAYLTNGLLNDPFAIGSTATQFFGYANCRAIAGEDPTQPFAVDSLSNVGISSYPYGNANRDTFGQNGWALQSVGPDRQNFALAPVAGNALRAVNDLIRNPAGGATHTLEFFYDPTNGTVSGGDIVRSAKFMN